MTIASIDEANVARHTLACLRSLDRKLDLVLDLLLRQGERLGHIERNAIELRRDVVDLKAEVALLESKGTVGRGKVLAILHRLGQGADRTTPQV